MGNEIVQDVHILDVALTPEEIKRDWENPDATMRWWKNVNVVVDWANRKIWLDGKLVFHGRSEL